MNKLVIIVFIGLGLALYNIYPVQAAKQEWVCKPGWGNWKHEKIQHSGYTTFYPMLIGKTTTMMPQYHPSRVEDKYTCKNWIKKQDFNKYDKDGNLKYEYTNKSKKHK